MIHGGIYLILCPSGFYVGRARQFAKRWKGHLHALRRNCHTNQRLQRSFNRHGEESFAFFPLLVVAHEDQPAIEEQLIKVAFGRDACMNLAPTATGYTSEMRHRHKWNGVEAKRIAATRAALQRPEVRARQLAGVRRPEVRLVHSIHSRRRMEEDPEFRAKSIAVMHTPSARAKAARRMREIGATPEHRERLRRKAADPLVKERNAAAHRKRGIPSFIAPDGTVHQVRFLNQFCRQHGLQASAMSILWAGRMLHYKGWRVYDPGRPPRLSRADATAAGLRAGKPKPSFRSPDGREFLEVVNVAAFAREHQLTDSALAGVWKGRVPHHKGWTAIHEQAP